MSASEYIEGMTEVECLAALERKVSDEAEAYCAFVADGGDPEPIFIMEEYLGVTHGS